MINLTLEEYYRMRDNGTLEDYLSNNSISFRDALFHLLDTVEEKVDTLENTIIDLEYELDEREESL